MERRFLTRWIPKIDTEARINRASKTVAGLAQELDVLDVRRDFGWQRRLRVGLGEAVAAEPLRVHFPPEIGVVAFPAAQVLDDQRFGSDACPQPVESLGLWTAKSVSDVPGSGIARRPCRLCSSGSTQGSLEGLPGQNQRAFPFPTSVDSPRTLGLLSRQLRNPR